MTKVNCLKNTSKTVIRCYDLLDASLAGGVKDFTDGKYFGDSFMSYEKAQSNQAEWLLDQINCKKGSRILDVGCGNGRILAAAEKRGATAIGITISEKQIKRCKQRGLSAHLMNYIDIPDNWNNFFDGVIANGSIEHFVQVSDAIDGRKNKIYQEMFKIFHRILKPDGCLATTIIHFNNFVDPKEIIKGSNNQSDKSDNFHFAKVLLEDFGGWYPVDGQLQECAKDFFVLKNHEDGTEDYHWTSEYWLSEMKKKITTSPRVWIALFAKLIGYPKATIKMLNNLIISQSWMWQFRSKSGEKTPTTLFRDTWKRID